jgi:predicted hydrocarbon binding protein
MRYPMSIDTWAHEPGRRLAEFVIRFRNAPGAFSKCSQAATEANVQILRGHLSAPRDSLLATWSIIADVTDSPVAAAGFKDSLAGLDVVESVSIASSSEGFMADALHFPIQTGDRRALLLSAGELDEMLHRLKDVFGSGAATIIDQMAEAMGRQAAKGSLEDFGREFAVGHLDDLLGNYRALGYGDIAIEHNKSSDFPVVLHARELFECQANSKRRLRQRSLFFRAHLRGYLSTLLNTDFDVSEVQCVTEGDDVCSFHVAVPVGSVSQLPTQTYGRNSSSHPQSTF